jgi:hypothetical protein
MNKAMGFAVALCVLGIFLIASSAPMVVGAADGVGNVVQTRSGKVSGATTEVSGEKVHIFKGIPYAAPPVGDLRWKAPQPVKPWSEVRDAHEVEQSVCSASRQLNG